MNYANNVKTVTKLSRAGFRPPEAGLEPAVTDYLFYITMVSLKHMFQEKPCV